MARTARATPADFLRSLEAFGRGGESLPRLREQIAAILAADPRHARLIATLVERARDEGRLPAPAAAALLRPARAALVEDLPTDWPGPRTGPASAPAPPLAGAPPAGTVLKDRFELLEQLGGTQAHVYRARDRRRAEAGSAAPWVALKIVAADGDPRAVAALRREALLGARLSHPGVVRVHDLDRDGDWLFLTLEWLDGESLDRVLGQRGERPLPRVQALPIVEGLCRALAHAHGEGIVHGDVKPGNVLLAADGRTRLIDFGTARDLRDGEDPGPLALTPAYASPALLGGAAPTPADDLFAVAGLAYRLLAGALPFGALTAAEAAAAGLRPAPVAALAPAQWRALDRALAFDPADRPADVTRFLAELKGPRDEGAAVAPGRAEDAAAGSLPAADPGAPARPRRTVIGLAGAGAVAAIAVVAGWLLGEPPPATPPTERVTAPVAAAPATRDEAATATPPAAAESGATVTRATPAGAGTASTGPARPASRAAPPAPVPPPAPAAAPAAPAAVAGNGTGPAPLPPAAPLAPAPSPAPAPDPSPAPAPRSPAPAATLAALDPGPAIARGSAGSGADLPAAPPAADAGSGEVAGEVAFSSLRLRRYVEADYPRTAAAMRRSGWVEVGFRVAADGRPGDLRVLAAEPAGRFDAAALAAVRRWRFAPPPAGSEPRTRVRLRFEP